MARRPRKFRRRTGQRRYRKLFLLVVEGSTSECQYFNFFNRQSTEKIRIQCESNKHKSAPIHVLRKMTNLLASKNSRKNDEAWIVIDTDQWPEDHLTDLYNWSQQEDHYGLAVSNPCFEYWLLLHFEDGDGVHSTRDCKRKIRDHLPGYRKHIDTRKLSIEMITEARNRACIRDNPPCDDWPHNTGTTVYRLVDNILESL